jgi:hypothetical protein
MRKFKLLFLVAIVASLAFSSCKKYEEGPSLTLRSRESRITGEWKMTKDTENGAAQTIDPNFRMKIEKGGTLTWTNTTGSMAGTWEFISNDEKVRFTFTYAGFTSSDDWTIMRLSSKELFLEQQDDNDLYRMEFENVD